MTRRLVYLGTPAMAVPPLRALVEAGHEVVGVVTGADKRRGRGGATSPSPVGRAALDLGLPVWHQLADVLTCGADLGVVVAYGRIIPVEILELLPMVNLHFSLLPRWRGAAPVERAILAGDTGTGVCVMRVEAGLDTGAIYAAETLAIGAEETAEDLRDRLLVAGSALLTATLGGSLPEPRPQTGTATVAAKLGVDDLHIGSGTDPEHLRRVVRLGQAWTVFRGKRLKILSVEADDGVCLGLRGVRPRTVQPEGRRPMGFDEWSRGAHPDSGEAFV